MTEPRIRGWIGEQSFELAEGHTKLMASIAEANVFGSVYRAEIENKMSAAVARHCAMEAVRAFRETQS